MKERIVCVEWEDAGFNSGYYDKMDEEKFNPVRTRTAGFVIKSNRKCLIVSHDRFYTKGKFDDERHITIIPRAMIRKVTELKAV